MDRRRWLGWAKAASLAPVASLARAQAAPNLNLVVPVPPGGSVDLTARLLGEHLPSVLKQNVVVENKPGASGSIAAAGVARQAGDENTLMLVFDSHVTNPLVYPKHQGARRHVGQTLLGGARVADAARSRRQGL
jgi:tripartite-type tricarboxylate transporter receptor subunit TctC